MHRIGVYWAPGHGRTTDIDYMRQLQPPAIRILDPDVQQISDAYKVCPNALLLPRDHSLSEQKSDANRDPVGTGKRHAIEWRDKIDYWRNQAQAREMPFPHDDQIVIVGINEPNEGVGVNAQTAYTMALCREARGLGLSVSALNLGVGWPANTGPDTPPDWSPYAEMLRVIEDGGHYLTLHSYWYDDPTTGWGWLAGRHWHVPDSYQGLTIIGECGVDRYVDAERWRNEGGNRGWRGNLEPEEYAADIAWYADNCDTRVVAVLPFLTDYRSREWESFDTAPAHPWLVMMAQSAATAPPAEHTVHIPVVTVGEPEQPQPEPRGDNWQRSIAFVRRAEGGWADDPNDSGGATMNGITLGTYTRWRQKHGYPPPTKGDLRAISDEETNRIYHEWYWLASGADRMAWPMCLAHFDLAVNGGVERAAQAYAAVGHNFMRYMAWRLAWYTRIPGWEHFGAAWVRRCAALMEEGA